MDLAFDPDNPGRRLRRALGRAPGPVGSGRLVAAADGRPLQVHRRRHHVAPAHDGASGRRGGRGPHRPRRVAPRGPRQVFALLDAEKAGGLYRSDDAGETWQKVNADRRALRTAAATSPRSRSTRRTPTSSTSPTSRPGSPPTAARPSPASAAPRAATTPTASGSTPRSPNIILLAGDQGAIVTVNGGADLELLVQPAHGAVLPRRPPTTSFPYRVYGGQQESGSAGIASRGNDGQITFREWHPVGVEEYGYVAPDPLDPNIVYGGKITRFDRRTGQVQNVSPEAAARRRPYRLVRTAPVLFSPVDPHDPLLRRRTCSGRRPTAARAGRRSAPTSRATSYEVPTNVGVFAGLDAAKATAPRRHLHDRALVPRRERDLGGHRRRARSTCTTRRRQDLDGRDAAGAHAVEQGVAHGRLALRHRDGLRGGQHASASTTCGRTSIARTTAGKTWTHDRRRHPRRRDRERGARGPGAQGPALRRHRARRVRLVRRRRPLAVAAPQHARHLDPRPRGARATTSSSARTAGRSGSSTTSRRCGRPTRRPRRRPRRSSPAQVAHRVRWNTEHRHAAAAGRARRARTRPTARSSTTG